MLKLLGWLNLLAVVALGYFAGVFLVRETFSGAIVALMTAIPCGIMSFLLLSYEEN